ncbi:hypothetical protein ALP98_04640 [Pseudomonas viridiflava]|uniref:Uncharacterized protein n=2 Tax=Pseudomonas syringae group TaxID=136849 RepID=A0A3M4IR46_PSEVI|nr:hypothetical protein ALQ30_04513 [Pseudomonas syringae pv. persicae]RMQ06790.1 hypothetical protein ALQ09_05163 [Pseudomonas viridiflava]RMQ71576.1 hypothetical protein ALP98_04640 [Pseudomonas viridiflava]
MLLSIHAGDADVKRFFHEDLIRILQTLYWSLRLYGIIKEL